MSLLGEHIHLGRQVVRLPWLRARPLLSFEASLPLALSYMGLSVEITLPNGLALNEPAFHVKRRGIHTQCLWQLKSIEVAWNQSTGPFSWNVGDDSNGGVRLSPSLEMESRRLAGIGCESTPPWQSSCDHNGCPGGGG